jgi:hypothetical protein
MRLRYVPYAFCDELLTLSRPGNSVLPAPGLIRNTFGHHYLCVACGPVVRLACHFARNLDGRLGKPHRPAFLVDEKGD